MTGVIGVDGEVTFSVEHPEAGSVSGTVRVRDRHVEVTSDRLTALTGGTSMRDSRRLAATLARLGVTVSLADDRGTIITIGDVRARLVDRLLTRSRFVRISRWRDARAIATSSEPAVLDIAAPPPGTPWPPVPTVRRRWGPITTTHDPDGGGHPRLYLTDASDPAAPGPLGVYLLHPGTTTIGSGEGLDLRLAHLDALQAEIVCTDDDEYVLVARGTTVPSTVGGRQQSRQTLRTGSRIQLGPWRMSYVRDEFADHGRPYGGRIGGELGHQRSQRVPTYRAGRQGF
jgi:hypothetical protein